LPTTPTTEVAEHSESAITPNQKSSMGLIDQGIAPRIGEPVADFALSTLDGEIVQLSDYFGEKLIVLNFWATWCTPCVVEMPDLDEIYRAHGDQLVVIGVNIQESRDVVTKFLQNDVDVSYPILFDADGQVTLGYNIFAQPTTMFIDLNGNLAPINKLPGKFGAFTPDELQQRIEEFINQTSESESTSSR